MKKKQRKYFGSKVDPGGVRHFCSQKSVEGGSKWESSWNKWGKFQAYPINSFENLVAHLFLTPSLPDPV